MWKQPKEVLRSDKLRKRVFFGPLVHQPYMPSVQKTRSGYAAEIPVREI